MGMLLSDHVTGEGKVDLTQFSLTGFTHACGLDVVLYM
jgi:hypothetical protein